MKQNSRNISILTICYALVMSTSSMMVLLGGIIGSELAPKPIWSTLPITMLVCGVAIFAMPASFIMKRIGRRWGFFIAAIIGALGSLLVSYGVFVQHFWLFCLPIVFLGANVAFAQQYRFAAAECAPEHNISQAVSWVLLGGLLAALLGPKLAIHGKNWLSEIDYVGSYISLAILNSLAAVLLLFFRDTKANQHTNNMPAINTHQIITNPYFQIALLAGATGFVVMTFIMTATPISMHVMGHHSLDDTAWVIQSHLMAMYLPALFTGYLIQFFGLIKIMITGALSLFACVIVAIFDQSLSHYWWALVCLGVGWNFLLISGTTILSQHFRQADGYKAQAINDFSIFSLQAIAALSAGTVIHITSWTTLNLICLPLLILLSIYIYRMYKMKKRPTT